MVAFSNLAYLGDDDANRLDAHLETGPSSDPEHLAYYYYNIVLGKGGDDILGTTPGMINVSLYGGADDDVLLGGSDADFLVGDEFDLETMIATGTGSDTIRGGDGADTVYGGGGSDIVAGDEGADLVYGGTGNDIIDGGTGSDIITGEQGNDILIGGAEADTFVIKPSNGKDIIRDFDGSGADHDTLDVQDMVAVKNFKDLIQHHADVRHDDVVLSLGAGTVVTLEDVKLKQLTPDDFLI